MSEADSARPLPEAHLEMPAASIDFDATYRFEIHQDGRFYLWTGVRARREGERAIFDYGKGLNGTLTECDSIVGLGEKSKQNSDDLPGPSTRTPSRDS
jgi:hypothetical protein